jgi:type II secretory pathway component GspD/PulD (secretin)
MLKAVVLLLSGALLAVPGRLLTSDGESQSDPLITLSFEQARLPAVVASLARQTGLSFIIAPEVGGIASVNVDFSEVPFSNALEQLAHEYSFCVTQPTDDIVSLKTCLPEPHERAFQFGGVTFLLPFIGGS